MEDAHGDRTLATCGDAVSAMDFYQEAIAIIERKHIPIIGPSVARQTFALVVQDYNSAHPNS